MPVKSFTILETSHGLEVTVPVKKSWGLTIFEALLLFGWGYGAVAVVQHLVTGEMTLLTRVIIFFWLMGWVVVGVLCAYTMLWNMFGMDRIALRADALLIKRDVLGMGRTCEYELDRVKNLRVATPDSDSGLSAPWARSSPGGLVAFDYGPKTYQFAAGVNEAEAHAIVTQLKTRHSFG